MLVDEKTGHYLTYLKGKEDITTLMNL